MYRTRVFLAVSIVALFAGMGASLVVAAPPVKDSGRDALVLRHCDVDYDQSTFVSGHGGTTMGLPLDQCLVRLGDQVKAGQIMGRLIDRDLRVQHAVLKTQAESDVEIRVAESKWNELMQKFRRVEKLRAKSEGYASNEEFESSRIQARTAQLAIEEAQYKRTIAALQCQEMEIQIQNRAIVAPHDGIVVDVYKKPGETVIAGQPVFHVIRADRLRVTGYANLGDFSRIKAGHRIEVTPETRTLDRQAQTRAFPGKVIFVDKRIDVKSQTCRIVAEVENDDMTLTAGVDACMTIYTSQPVDISSPKSAPGRALPDQKEKLPQRTASTP